MVRKDSRKAYNLAARSHLALGSLAWSHETRAIINKLKRV